MPILAEYELPIRLESANIQVHWGVKSKKNKKIATLIREKCHALRKATLPCKITLTRYSPRKFDYDNMVYAFKHVRDTVADMIKPGLRPGQADADERMIFEYNQEKTYNSLYYIIIKIETL